MILKVTLFCIFSVADILLGIAGQRLLKKNIEMEYSRIFLLFYGLLLCFVSMGTHAVNSRVVSHMSFVFINPCYPRVTRGQTVFTVRIKSEHGNIRKPFFKSSLRARIESLSFVNESRSKEEREFW